MRRHRRTADRASRHGVATSSATSRTRSRPAGPIARLQRAAGNLAIGRLLRRGAFTSGVDASREIKRKEGSGESKPEKPTATFAGCNDKQKGAIEAAIPDASKLAARAIVAVERDYPLTYESSAMSAHFGHLDRTQRTTVIDRYRQIQNGVGAAAYTCAARSRTVTEGTTRVDLCGEAHCPGSRIKVFPNLGTAECPAALVLLHEAAHNTGACDDVNAGGAGYPPSASEDNAYSYENFAAALTGGYKTPSLKKRTPKGPR
ncbi:MAG TPA: hypothetical protein VFO19_11695 [Vicinamibacterales bacterium]|nr:hypothetical protein [Vicinamibacterales bacterium]